MINKCCLSRRQHWNRIGLFKSRQRRSVRISNVFWSANNYELPHPALKINSRIEYWYGEYEKKARKNDMAYINSYFEGVTFRQIDGMEHGELVMIHLSRFDRIIKKALEAVSGRGYCRSRGSDSSTSGRRRNISDSFPIMAGKRSIRRKCLLVLRCFIRSV